MSDKVRHECGLALIRLKKDLKYYREKYGSSRYGLHSMYLLMEKMINRGQDGAGLGTVKIDTPPGINYIDRIRSVATKPVQDIFHQIHQVYLEKRSQFPQESSDPEWQKKNIPFLGEILLGHLRYGTFGGNTIFQCHPFRKQSNWKTKNLLIAGNFNLTNVDELFNNLVELGQHPREKSDTVTILEKIGHFLDRENERLFRLAKEQGLRNIAISEYIRENLDIAQILKDASKKWDGGYVMGAIIGHGDAFVIRDPNGIRPAFYYEDDEIVAVASERPVIQTVFNVKKESVKELPPGHAIIIKKNGQVQIPEILPAGPKTSCSFERIYFSRGNDADIYKERQKLGFSLAKDVLASINYDLENTVFSYIPNTAEIAFGGLIEGIHAWNNQQKFELIRNKNLNDEELKKIINRFPRIHKVVIKDAKQRTFITDDENRDQLVNIVYDITYDTIRPGIDTLVVMDDSIVRGTTLRKSILTILSRLEPAKIIIVSSSPQIRYPDCYGIDMSVLKRFVAFEATVALWKEKGKENELKNLYDLAKQELKKKREEQENILKKVYEPFRTQEISKKIAELIRPKDFKPEFEIIYQTLEGLHASCPNHKGDWYFSGNYPTPGGNMVCNKALVNYFEGINQRSY